MSYGQPSRRVAVIAANRIPFARNNSAYTMASNQDMMTAALNGLIERCKLQGELIDRFIFTRRRQATLVLNAAVNLRRVRLPILILILENS